jgi:hypothetical protein
MRADEVVPERQKDDQIAGGAHADGLGGDGEIEGADALEREPPNRVA